MSHVRHPRDGSPSRPPARRRGAATALALAATLVASAAAPASAAPTTTSADVPEPGRVVVHETFDGPGLPAGWTAVEGDWTVEDGRLVGRSANQNQQARITFGEHLDNYRFEATVRFEQVANAARWQALALDIAPDGSVPWSQAALRSASTATNGVEFALRTAADQWSVTNTASAPHDAGTGRDVHVAVEVHKNEGRWFFDGTEVLRTTQVQRSPEGVLGFVVNAATVSYDDVRVTELEPLPLIELREPGDTALVVGHRGNSSVAPENTLPATVASRKANAEYVEVDIDFTADDVPVLMHDSTVNRTTNGTGRVRDLTLEQIRALDAGSWFSPAFAGTPVPTLEDLLVDLRANGGKLLLEFKSTWPVEQARIATDLIHEYGLQDDVLLQSFDLTTIANLRTVAPELPRGILVSSLPADPVALSRQYDAVAFNPSGTALQTRPGLVEELHAEGIGIFVWTLDDAAQWAAATALGVDGIITNRPDRLVGWNLRYSETRPEEPGPEPEPEPEPEDGEVALRVDIVDEGPGPQPGGELTWRFATTGLVDLGEAVSLGDTLSARGSLHQLLVTDTRRDPSSPWQISAQVTDFTHDDATVPAANLGWTPRVDVEGAGALPGAPVPSGIGGNGPGLSTSQVLAHAPSDEYKGDATATVGAELELQVPLDQAPGTYTSTLTVTVVQ